MLFFKNKEKENLSEIIKKQEELMDRLIFLFQDLKISVEKITEKVMLYDSAFQRIGNEIHRLSWEIIELENKVKKIEETY